MNRAAAFLAVSLAIPLPVFAQSRSQDSLSILDVLRHRTQAMQSRNADLQRGMYAPGAVWINAFGRRRSGPDSIIAFLSRLYADPGYQESRVVRENPVEILFIRPDVVVVHGYHEREGQRLADGRVINRRIHSTYVLSREDGRWLVQYQFIGDERESAAATRP